MSDEQDELEQLPAEMPAPRVKPRPADCQARLDRARMVCKRCGQSWPDIADGKACRPITFKQIADQAITLAMRAEASLARVRGLDARGMPTDDGAAAELELAIAEKISRIVDAIAADPQLRAAVNKAAR